MFLKFDIKLKVKKSLSLNWRAETFRKIVID